MNNLQGTQKGASAILNIIILAVVIYAVFVGSQYVPQYIKAGTMDSILKNLQETHSRQPFANVHAVGDAIDSQLNINQMTDMRSSFQVTQNGGAFVVRVSYPNELNLLYETKAMPYEKTFTLR